MDPVSTFPGPYPSLLPAGEQSEVPAISLRRPLIVLGTREDAHIRLNSRTVSHTHAVIVVEPSGAYIHDLASREGVFVNRQQIHDAGIEDGDEIRIGRFEFIFQAGGLDPSRGPTGQAPAAYLRIKRDKYPLAQRVASIGRRQGMDIIVDHEDVASTHALVYAYQGQHVLRDLNSPTGVMVNGRLLSKKVELRGGEVIRIGPTTMRYVLEAMPAAQPENNEEVRAEYGMPAAILDMAVANEPDATKSGEEEGPAAAARRGSE